MFAEASADLLKAGGPQTLELAQIGAKEVVYAALGAGVVYGVIKIAVWCRRGAQACSAAKGIEEVVTIARWGRPGLESGDWVMKGGANWWNYFKSGKWDPMPWNHFASFSSGGEFEVLKSTLSLPKKEGAIGMFKGVLLGQRQYFP